MQNFKLTISYDGSRYNGWQRQGNTDNTIQAKIEQVIRRMLTEAGINKDFVVEIHGSGRTDAGVHALAQVANIHVPDKIIPEKLLAYCNQYLPEDIRITSIETVDERFHARLSAKQKHYRYMIDCGEIKDPFFRKYSWGLDCSHSLDVEAMQQATSLFVGTHDFMGFQSNKRMKKSTIRTIDQIEIKPLPSQPNILILDFYGNGFLYNMVRIMTGTLVEIGLHEREISSINECFEKKDRSLSGGTAPAKGLFLVEVGY